MAEMIPERCVEHKVAEKDIMGRLERLEEDIQQIQVLLKDKVDAETLREIVDRRTKEIEELKKSVLSLTTADQKHSESLAGIYAILQGFKETQDLLRQDYAKLTDCYTQSSIHIASITAMLKERANVIEVKKPEHEEPATMWGTIKSIVKSKPIIYALVGLITTIIFILITNQTAIIEIIRGLLGS